MLLILFLMFVGTAALKAQDGTIDGSFGSTGTVTTAIGLGSEQASSVALQSDGKIVVAGNSVNGTDWNFAVVRYNSNGTLDSTFNDSGKVTTSLNSTYEESRGIAVQSDGKIVVAGYTTNGVIEDFVVLRYNSNGTLDNTFDGDGIVTTDFGYNSEEPYNIGIQSDGKIVVVGYIYDGSSSDFALARYNTNGSLDTSFNGTGKIIKVMASTGEEAKGIAFQSDGKIVVAGHSDGDVVILRYNTNGTLDTSFNSTGMVVKDVASDYEEAYNVALQSDGKIVVGGYTNVGSYSDVLLIRVDSTGAIDPTFDGDGIVSTAIGSRNEEAKSIAIQSDGKIVVAGYYDNEINGIGLVLRYNSNGTLDNTFATNGVDTTAIGTNANDFADIVLQTNGKIVVVGSNYNGTDYDFALRRYETDGTIDGTLNPLGKVITSVLSDSWAAATVLQPNGKIIAGGTAWDGSQNKFAVARYTSTGALDNTFGSSGIVTTAVGTSDDGIYSIAVQTDGKIVAAGYTKNGSNVYQFAVVRYDSTGALDNTFGTNGKVTKQVGSSGNWGYGVAIQTDGKILIVGDANSEIVVVRYTSNGTLDTTFDVDGIVSTPVTGTYAEGKAIAVQTDGKIVVAGNTDDGANADIAVVRFNSNGSLDTTFNSTGKVSTSIGSGFDEGFGVAITSEQKIVVGGDYYNGTNSDYAAVRYNSNGTLDTTFSGDGKATAAIGAGDDEGRGVAVQSDGKVIVIGATNNGTDMDFGVVRFNSNGTLDTDFDGDGKVTTAIGPSYDRAYGVVLQSDNNIVVAGYANNGSTNDFALVRYISTSNPVIALSYSSSIFSEANANNGSINNSSPVTITLANDALTGTDGDNFVTAGKVVASNLPSGLTAVVTRTSPTTVSVTLTGNASNHTVANSIANLTLAFQNSAFNSGVASAVTNATKSDLQITFNDPSANNTLSFDGSNDVVSVPASSSINLSQGTWEAWVKVNSLGHHNRILFKEGADLNGKYELYILDNSFGGSIRADIVIGGTRYNAIAGVGITTGTWTHIAATFDSTNFKIYVNGTLSGTTAVIGAPVAIDANTGPLGIGGNVDGTASSFFEGAIDEVRIWNIVRTQSEIAADMNNTSLSASTTGLQAYYHFDHGTGGGTNTNDTTLTDATSNANNGRLNNFALTGSSSNWISSDNPLPVELTSFTAVTKKQGVELVWKTATEVNNYGFEIEKSRIQKSEVRSQNTTETWSKAGFVEGNGTTNGAKQYSFTDKNLSAGEYLYRLKQIDRDGKFTYSQAVEVSIANTPKDFTLEQNYPNPFNPSTVIGYQLPVSSHITLKVYDAIGREVAALVNEVKEAGSYSVTFDASKLSSGIYFARLQSGDKVQLKKLILIK
jgi:uncharacterized delta-60 repeat protein